MSEVKLESTAGRNSRFKRLPSRLRLTMDGTVSQFQSLFSSGARIWWSMLIPLAMACVFGYVGAYVVCILNIVYASESWEYMSVAVAFLLCHRHRETAHRRQSAAKHGCAASGVPVSLDGIILQLVLLKRAQMDC